MNLWAPSSRAGYWRRDRGLGTGAEIEGWILAAGTGANNCRYHYVFRPKDDYSPQEQTFAPELTVPHVAVTFTLSITLATATALAL